MTRWFEQYTAYSPIRTTTTSSMWGGWRAISLRCLGCKHHFLRGTASMCACASRTLVRTEHGDECASYYPRGAAMTSAIDSRTAARGRRGLMCEYCDGSKKPIETEVDGEAHIELTPDDYEYPDGFLLDVYKRQDDGLDDGWGTWMYSFIVPCCPMCGRRLKAGDTR